MAWKAMAPLERYGAGGGVVGEGGAEEGGDLSDGGVPFAFELVHRNVDALAAGGDDGGVVVDLADVDDAVLFQVPDGDEGLGVLEQARVRLLAVHDLHGGGLLVFAEALELLEHEVPE